MTAEEIIEIPVPAATLARALSRHDDYRVVRRLGRMIRRDSRLRSKGELCVCVLDCETTGTDPGTDKIIELAVQKVWLNEDGRIVQTGRPYSWLEDPARSIPEEVRRITGLTDADVRGTAIADGEAYSLIWSAGAVLSHNARFDRPFVEARLKLSGQAWICSLTDLDWREHGFEGRSMSQLLWQCGWFYSAHRAAGDVNARLHLLDHRLAGGTTVMKELLAAAQRPSWIIEAVEAPLSARGPLKARGYRWEPPCRCWWKEVSDEGLEAELGWATDHVYGGMRAPVHRRISWRERYEARS